MLPPAISPISPVSTRRNIELKARLADLESSRRIARRLANRRLADEVQTDTYFVCQRGRLKLREIRGAPALLIGYDREDVPGTRCSSYRLVEVGQAALLRETLAAALGVRVVVEKKREIYLYDQTRVHLDQVRDLGTFLEFEVVLRPGQTEREGHWVAATLQRAFAIDPRDVVGVSYSDLLLARQDGDVPRGAE